MNIAKGACLTCGGDVYLDYKAQRPGGARPKCIDCSILWANTVRYGYTRNRIKRGNPTTAELADYRARLDRYHARQRDTSTSTVRKKTKGRVKESAEDKLVDDILGDFDF